MSSLPNLSLSTDTFIADTFYMTNEEAGAFMRLLMFAWRSPGCSLPNDDVRLASELGITPRRWAKLKRIVLETSGWGLEGGTWCHHRLSDQYAAAMRRRARKPPPGDGGGGGFTVIEGGAPR